MEISCCNLYSNIVKASPIETSEPATTKIKMENKYPIISSKNTENTKKFIWTDSNTISNEINTVIRFFRKIKIPDAPIIKTIIENSKYRFGEK